MKIAVFVLPYEKELSSLIHMHFVWDCSPTGECGPRSHKGDLYIMPCSLSTIFENIYDFTYYIR